MKIRIVKASKPSYWYADKIGEVFEVTGRSKYPAGHFVKYSGSTTAYNVAYEDCEEVVEHNSQLYHVVDRQAKIGDLVVITKGAYDEVSEVFYTGDIGKIVENSDHGMYEFKVDFSGLGNNVVHEDGMFYLGGSECSKYSVVELIEQSSQSEDIDELDLIVNLSQVVAKLTNRLLKTEEEVAELKRELSEYKATVAHRGRTLEINVGELKDDIVDLEDRLDENEKDTEELKKQAQSPVPWALEGDVIELNSRLHLNEKYTEELIRRMNDLGDGVKEPRHKRSNLISELERRRHEALCKRNRYEDMGDEGNYRYFDGKMVGLIEVIGIVEEALRNG